MKRRVAAYIISLLLLSACGQKEEVPVVQVESCVEMTLNQGQTKAHFEDLNGSASFVWDVGSSMIAVVGHDSATVQWNGGEYYSPMHISLIDPSRPNKVLRASSEYSLESIAAQTGDPLPLSGGWLGSL